MNTCLEAGAAARAELKAKAAAAAAGAKVREGYVKRAAGSRVDWAARLKHMQADITAQQKVVDGAKGRPAGLTLLKINCQHVL